MERCRLTPFVPPLCLIRPNQTYLAIECRIKSTGKTCPGYDPTVDYNDTTKVSRSRFRGFTAGSVVSGFYHPDDGYLYIGATTNLNASNATWGDALSPSPVWGKVVIVCIDVNVGCHRNATVFAVY